MKRNITLLSVFLLFAFMQAMGQTTYTVTLYVTSVTGQNLEGTPVVLENVNTGLVYNRSLDGDGMCTITRVLAGTHMLTITPRDLALYSNEIEVTDNMSLEIELVEEVRTPYALTASTSHDNKTGYNEVALVWNRETDYFFDDFESYDAFSIDFAPWTGIDGDHVPAAQLYGSYPNSGLNQYATIFNPLVIDPPVWYTYPVLRPYSGKQYVGFIRTATGTANDDWLISPQIHVGVRNVVRFLAKAGDRYDEQFLVYISETGNERGDFVPLTQGNYESVDYESWHTIQYDLSAYEGKDVYIAIRYISRSTFMLMVDDFFVGAADIDPSSIAAAPARRVRSGSSHAPQAGSEHFVIYLDGDSVTDTYSTQYTLRDVAPGRHTVEVEARYIVSKSERAQIEVALPAENEMASLTIEAHSNGISPDGTEVSYTDTQTGLIFTDTIRDGLSVHGFLPKSEYIVNINSRNFELYDTSLTLVDDMTLFVPLIEKINAPYNLTADVSGRDDGNIDVQLRWNQELGWSDDFESYPDFAQQFGEWTTFDGDQMATYPIGNANQEIYEFPGSGEEMACLIWNPLATVPSMEGDYAAYPPEGSRCVAFFSPQQAKANDWLISPPIKIYNDYVVRFDLKAYTSLYAETVAICVSEENDPATFTVLDEIGATDEWMVIELDLSQYAGKEVYVALNYTTYDGFFMLVDEFYVGPANSVAGATVEGVSYDIFLDDERIGNTDECSFMIEGIANVHHTAGVKAIYPTGESEMTVVEIAPTAIVSVAAGEVRVYGHNGILRIDNTSDSAATVTVCDLSGRLVAVRQCGERHSSIELPSGCYIVKIEQNEATRSCKVVL